MKYDLGIGYKTNRWLGWMLIGSSGIGGLVGKNLYKNTNLGKA